MNSESEYEDFASFATCWFSTLTKISGSPKGIVSYKNTQYILSYVYFNLPVYIIRDFSLALVYGGHFFYQAIPTNQGRNPQSGQSGPIIRQARGS